jgi:hypothetical protein
MGETTPISDDARAKGRELVQRIKSDPTFRQRLQGDPAGVMREAGLPEDAHLDIARETGIDAEVAGYARCWVTCDETCVVTCLVTSA